MQVEYVLFRHCSGWTDSGHLVGIAYRPIGSSLLHTRYYPNWDRDMSEEDLEYIQDVFSELDRRGRQQEIWDFQEIAQMSAGCLRTEVPGVCEDEDIPSLVPTQADVS